MEIRQLDDQTIGKIAAGEVIERPASVVKELLENALDAGASRINVSIEGGGTTRIEVVDNGHGMSADQLSLALRRHATSKLSSFEDLDRLRTLGFRGEALPSIAAVSHLAIRSRPQGTENGSQATVAFGEVRPVVSVASAEGTSVSIADLFENVPARRKFLRKPSTEKAAAQRAVEAYALANPAVAFSLEVDQRKVFSTQGDGDHIGAAFSIFGSDVGNAAVLLSDLDGSTAVPGVRTCGWICGPSVNRATRQGIILFVNGRWIQNRPLTYALEEAYHTLLMIGRHPVAMIAIELDPSEVDVNVHPTKAEVKFADERAVARAVARSVHATLSAMPQPGVPRIAFDDHGLLRFQPQPAMAGMSESAQFMAPAHRGESAGSDYPVQIIHRELPVLRVLGQIGSTYIIAEGPEGLYLIDQHAAHERVLYERFQARLVADQIERQPMLDPVVIDLTPEEAAIAAKSMEELTRLGFDIEPFGDHSVVVRSVPLTLVGSDIPERLRLILDELAEGGVGTSWLDSVAISVACHTSIRAGQSLALAEMRELVQQLEQTQQPRACGHGRPTMLQLTQNELEKLFSRK
ncbi:MAG: DNA mismatch repair endonuclease MutL [Thermomicrobiales bacterium]